MNPNLNHAIIQFLANEFKTTPENILPESDFVIDFNLSKEQTLELITRMQDALDFILPEDKVGNISSVSDLLHALEPESETLE